MNDVYGYGGGLRVWGRVLIIKYLMRMVLCGWLTAFSTAWAQTEVEGEVSSEWNAEGSPYIVVDSTWVPEGEELRILEGVTVRFAAETGLYVYGMMSAIGTEEDSVHFTTNEEGEEWAGIHFYQQRETYEFEYCTIRNAFNGLVTSLRNYLSVIHSDINCTYIAFGLLDPNNEDLGGNRYHFENSLIVGGRRATMSRSRLEGINCYLSTGGYEGGRWGFSSFGSIDLTNCDVIGTVGQGISADLRNCNIYSPDEFDISVWIVGGLIHDCYVEGSVTVLASNTDVLRNEIEGILRVQSYSGLLSENVSERITVNSCDDTVTVANCVATNRVSFTDSNVVEMFGCHILGDGDPRSSTLNLQGLDNNEPPYKVHHNLILGRIHSHGDYIDLGMYNNTIIAESLNWALIEIGHENGSADITNNIMICEGDNDGLYYPHNYPADNANIRYNLMYGFDQFSYRYHAEDFELHESNLFDVDPLLVSLDPLDPRPTQDSPCVDAGHPNSPRDPDGTRADIGMFYYHQELKAKPRREVEQPPTELLSVYPNPFNSVSTFAFSLEQPGTVRIDIFNAFGRKQAELLSGNFSTGLHSVSWDGGGLPSGDYLIRMSACGKIFTRKVTLLK